MKCKVGSNVGNIQSNITKSLEKMMLRCVSWTPGKVRERCQNLLKCPRGCAGGPSLRGETKPAQGAPTYCNSALYRTEQKI